MENFNDIRLLKDVPLSITVELGATKDSIENILKYKNGTIIDLDKELNTPVSLKIGDKEVAQGEIITVDGYYGIKITNIKRPAL